jgi:hypothetical protein
MESALETTALAFNDAWQALSSARSGAQRGANASSHQPRRPADPSARTQAELLQAVRTALIYLVTLGFLVLAWRRFLGGLMRGLMPGSPLVGAVDAAVLAIGSVDKLDGSLVIPACLAYYIWGQQVTWALKVIAKLTVVVSWLSVLVASLWAGWQCYHRQLPKGWDLAGSCREVRRQCEPATIPGAQIAADGYYAYTLREGVVGSINQLDVKSAQKSLLAPTHPSLNGLSDLAPRCVSDLGLSGSLSTVRTSAGTSASCRSSSTTTRCDPPLASASTSRSWARSMTPSASAPTVSSGCATTANPRPRWSRAAPLYVGSRHAARTAATPATQHWRGRSSRCITPTSSPASASQAGRKRPGVTAAAEL